MTPYGDKKSLWSALFGNGWKSDSSAKTAEQEITNILNDSNLNGIEGIPYQFDSIVDRRLTGTKIGRKYAEKIYSRMPLLILTPCKPVFMGDSTREDKLTVLSTLLEPDRDWGGVSELISSPGRYYTMEFDYDKYWQYVNIMLTSIARYMNIGDISLPRLGKLANVDWSKESNNEFKRFFTGRENVVYYLDGMDTMSRSFSNSTTDSSIASTINGFSDQANEIKFLFGAQSGSLSSLVGSGLASLTDSVTSTLGALEGALLGKGIVDSIANKGLMTIVNGGKIVFPQIWQDSSADESYSLEVKLRSPDHDNLSIFLNILKPYCKLLALTLPHEYEDADSGEINEFAYNSPFLCKAYCKGMFSVDYGMITGLNVTSGAQCQWNDDGLPTQIDISIDITNLYKSLAMSTGIQNTVHNTAFIDFLANLSGLNINNMEIGRKIKLYYYYNSYNVVNIPSNVHRRVDQTISRLAGNLYSKLS